MSRTDQATVDHFSKINLQLLKHFWAVAKPYWFSEERWKARGLLLLLLFLSLIVSGLNVGISYVFRYVDTALAEREAATFWRFISAYAGILVVGTPIVVIYQWLQEKLGLYWRGWMTNSYLDRYFRHRAYYEINANTEIDNPDQRIAEDIKSFTQTSLAFVLILLDSIVTLIAFTGVLLSISLSLSATLLIYAVIGTVISIWIGKRLIGLNFVQLRREANLRYSLVHVRDNAESIAFYRGEQQESTQVKQRLVGALQNFDVLIGWQRNLGFFTVSYQYFVQALPYLVVAPIYLAGETDFGTITQSAIAFRQIFSALSIIVLRIQDLTTFGAGVQRLAGFSAALDAAPKHESSDSGHRTIDMTEDDALALERVTLQTPNYRQTLVQDLSVRVQPGQGLVIVGHSGCGKSSLLRAIAGLWNSGTGHIIRPNLNETLFLPQRPYMILGSLRDQLLYPNTNSDLSDTKLNEVLQQVNLANLPERVGGLDVQLDWADVLSLGEQQRLAFARLLLTQPRYAILDEATSALDIANEKMLYQKLRNTATTFISVGHRPTLLQYHDYVLELRGDTDWQLTSVEDYSPNLEVFA